MTAYKKQTCYGCHFLCLSSVYIIFVLVHNIIYEHLFLQTLKC